MRHPIEGNQMNSLRKCEVCKVDQDVKFGHRNPDNKFVCKKCIERVVDALYENNLTVEEAFNLERRQEN